MRCVYFHLPHGTTIAPHTHTHHNQTAKQKKWNRKKRNYINYSSDEPNSCNALHFAFLCFAVHLHKNTLLAIRLIWIAATYGYWNLFTIFFFFFSSLLLSLLQFYFLHFTAFSIRNTRNILTGYELIQITLFGFDFDFWVRWRRFAVMCCTLF